MTKERLRQPEMESGIERLSQPVITQKYVAQPKSFSSFVIGSRVIQPWRMVSSSFRCSVFLVGTGRLTHNFFPILAKHRFLPIRPSRDPGSLGFLNCLNDVGIGSAQFH